MTPLRHAIASGAFACAAAFSAMTHAQSEGGASLPPSASTPPAASAPSNRASACNECGVVQSIRYVEREGQASGVGAVAGGVLGGVLGHQIGSGRGNTVATIAGAGAGAYAGNRIEKNRNRKAYWTVAIRMDNGSTRNLTYSAKPSAQEGAHVKLLDGGKRLALLRD